MLFLCSCASPPAKAVTDGFRCHVQINYDSVHVEATLERSADARTVLTVHEPSQLNGLILSLVDDRVTVSYGGFETSFSEDYVAASAVQAIGEALDACASDARGTVKGETALGDYILTTDEKNGMPLTLELPTLGFSAVFSEWTLL